MSNKGRLRIKNFPILMNNNMCLLIIIIIN